jgi:hypothetical protein
MVRAARNTEKETDSLRHRKARKHIPTTEDPILNSPFSPPSRH